MGKTIVHAGPPGNGQPIAAECSGRNADLLPRLWRHLQASLLKRLPDRAAVQFDDIFVVGQHSHRLNHRNDLIGSVFLAVIPLEKRQFGQGETKQGSAGTPDILAIDNHDRTARDRRS